jgi:Peptidase family M48
MLEPLPYHREANAYFKQQSKVWQFFSAGKQLQQENAEFKAHLLKNTYKFDEAVETALYDKVKRVKEKLGLSLPVTIYQLENSFDVNATIAHVDGVAHIVFSGNLLQQMSDEEIVAILAHELSHIFLYQLLDKELEVTDSIVTAMGNNAGSTTAHYETARLFKLYNEIFCDRGAYVVTGNHAPIVSSLVKISTGLPSVNADSYCKQAEEIFSHDASTRTQGITHPENFIRARAIWLWHTQRDTAETIIRQMIEGSVSMDELDLFQQQKLSGVTQQLIQAITKPHWMQSPIIMALTKQYFPTFAISTAVNNEELGKAIEPLHQTLKDYLAYVLYDFCTADKDLEDVPLGLCFSLATDLSLEQNFATAVKKERKLTEKKLVHLKQGALDEFNRQQSLPAEA